MSYRHRLASVRPSAEPRHASAATLAVSPQALAVSPQALAVSPQALAVSPQALAVSPQALAIALLALALALPAAATTLPAGYSEQNIEGTWAGAVGIQFEANGRAFVWERDGYVWIVDGGVKSAQPFLDLREEVGGWRDFGLLGFTLHPNFEINGHFYVYYVIDRHHLLEFGTGSYSASTDEYYAATQGRITRYKAKLKAGSTDYSDAFETDYTTRLVIHGDAPGTSCPILYESHGTGTIVIGTDGTLLAACGDGASYSTQDNGSIGHTYYAQAIADGIMSADDNVGAFRAQKLTSFSGKILRMNPDTGDAIPSNPWYDAAEPRSAKSLTWALGLRNPYRMVLRPNTGQHDSALGDPGVIVVGDVGWGTWEDIHVVKEPGQNFGWPIYEGMTTNAGYAGANIANQAAPNPLYGQPGCTSQYFTFQQLLINETLNPSPSWPNPCDTGQQIPAEFVQMHSRPEIDYRHGSGPSRWSTFDLSGNPVHYDLGATPPAGITAVPGPQFGGNAATAGVFYQGSDFEPSWQGVYFHGDYGAAWIRGVRLDPITHEPTEVMNFATAAGGVVFLATSPIDGGLYYSSYTSPTNANFRRVSYIGSGNFPPTAIASIVGDNFGPEPLQIDFVGDQSIDPEALPLDYLWSFGDGNSSTLANPSHVFDPGSGLPTLYTVTLTVTDDGQANPDEQDITTLFVSANNTPPLVSITSPADGSLYSMTQSEVWNLSASFSDLEHSGGELACGWVTTLHHNDHSHVGFVDPSCTTTTVISPAGCDGNTYSWEVSLTVSDAAGLYTTDSVRLYPDCPNLPPVANDDSASVFQGYAVEIDVLANDIDAVGSIDPATLQIVQAPLHGTIDAIDPLTGVVSYSHDGTANLTDSFGYTVDDDDAATSNAATVIVSASNEAPQVTITSPLDLSGFSVGGLVGLSAVATDSEDFVPPTIDWQVQRIHGASLIPNVYTASGASPPGYTIPAVGAPGDHISYLVLVSVTDSVGATASDQVHILPALPPANDPPQAAFSASATIGSPPFNVLFDASSSSDADADYLLYRWDFDDGTTASGQLVSHSFGAQGVYDVTLTLTDAVGATDTAVIQIDVLEPGLSGEYFNNQTLTGLPALTRSDPVVDFGWGSGSPDPSIATNNFSVRWSGQISPLYSEPLTLFSETDDGVRLWIDGSLVIDRWVDQSPTEVASAPIPLVAGQKYDLLMEYYENGGGAVARLRWQSASQPKQIVPAGRLSGPVPPNQPPIASDDVASLVQGYSVVIGVLGNDFDDAGELDPSTLVVTSAAGAGSTSVDGVSGAITYFHDGLAAGNDSFEYSVEDQDGLVSNSATAYLTIYPPPTLVIDLPSEGQILPNGAVQVAYSISADNALFDHLHLQIDADPYIADHTLTGSWEFLSVAPGPHTLTTWLVRADHQAIPYPTATDSVGFDVLPPAVCGNGALELGEDCDDANLADGDCCSSACAFETLGSSCDDADACSESDSCDGAGACTAGSPLACDDSLYCNGLESCDSGSGCQAGTAPSPDDGVACTLDSCDEPTDTLIHAPDDLFCDDADACTADSCDGISGCVNAPIEGCGAAVPAGSPWMQRLLALMLLAAGGLAASGRRRERA